MNKQTPVEIVEPIVTAGFDLEERAEREIICTAGGKSEYQLQEEAIKLIREMRERNNEQQYRLVKSRSCFTKATVSKDERKAKRKAQKLARRATR